MAMLGPIWTCEVVGIRSITEEARQRFLKRLAQEQKSWNTSSNTHAVPVEVFAGATKHFYALRFLKPLLTGDGFVNMHQLVVASEVVLGMEFRTSQFYTICQNLADELVNAGVELEYR